MNNKSRDCLVKILLECDKIDERCKRFHIDQELFVNDAAYADMLLMPLAQIGELSVHVDSEVLKDYAGIAARGLCKRHNRARSAFELHVTHIWEIIIRESL